MEAEKYQQMWDMPEYRKYAPGEHLAQEAAQTWTLPGKVIDFGAGTGRGALRLHRAGFAVVMLDFTDNSLDEEVRHELGPNFKFLQTDLSGDIFVKADYGFCTDVMEHIPEDQVDAVLTNIQKATNHGYLNISTIPDGFGEKIGETLHVTVKPWDWWGEKVCKIFGPDFRLKPSQSSVAIWY